LGTFFFLDVAFVFGVFISSFPKAIGEMNVFQFIQKNEVKRDFSTSSVAYLATGVKKWGLFFKKFFFTIFNGKTKK